MMTSLGYQPPTQITPMAKDGVLTVLQLTDLHRYDQLSLPLSKRNLDPHYQDCFEVLLTQALASNRQCDLILVTGDLVNEVNSQTYDQIFDRLAQTGIPFACIAGNHDVTDEVGDNLPFEQRQLVAQPLDERLLDHHLIDTPYWQLLLINSSVPGLVGGEVRADTVDWLRGQLCSSPKPALLALHHHVIPAGAAWIDGHMASRTQQLWSMLSEFEQLQVIINGHTHQEQTLKYRGITVYTTPATSYQFKPYSNDFAFDEEALPGYRWLQLDKQGNFKSWVERLNNTDP